MLTESRCKEIVWLRLIRRVYEGIVLAIDCKDKLLKNEEA